MTPEQPLLIVVIPTIGKNKEMSKRLTEVANFMAHDYPYQQIAIELGISERTVIDYVKKLHKFTESCTNAGMMYKLIKMGYIE